MQCPVVDLGRPRREAGRRVHSRAGSRISQPRLAAAPPLRHRSRSAWEPTTKLRQAAANLAPSARAEDDLLAIEEVRHRQRQAWPLRCTLPAPSGRTRHLSEFVRFDLLQLGPPCGGSAVNKRHTVNDRRCIAGQQGPRIWPVGVVRNVRRQGLLRSGWAAPVRATPTAGRDLVLVRRRRAGRPGGQRRRPGMSSCCCARPSVRAPTHARWAHLSRKVLWPTGKADRPWRPQRRRIHGRSDSRGKGEARPSRVGINGMGRIGRGSDADRDRGPGRQRLRDRDRVVAVDAPAHRRRSPTSWLDATYGARSLTRGRPWSARPPIQEIPVLQQPDPADLPWEDLGADLVWRLRPVPDRAAARPEGRSPSRC